MANKDSRFFDAINAFHSFCLLNRISEDKLRIQFVPRDQATRFNLQIAIRDELVPLNDTLGLKDLEHFQFLGFPIEILGPPLDDCTGYEISG